MNVERHTFFISSTVESQNLPAGRQVEIRKQNKISPKGLCNFLRREIRNFLFFIYIHMKKILTVLFLTLGILLISGCSQNKQTQFITEQDN
jgi:hypothetical protein